MRLKNILMECELLDAEEIMMILDKYDPERCYVILDYLHDEILHKQQEEKSCQ